MLIFHLRSALTISVFFQKMFGNFFEITNIRNPATLIFLLWLVFLHLKEEAAESAHLLESASFFVISWGFHIKNSSVGAPIYSIWNLNK